MKHIPNLITSLNLVSGFVAIIFAANGDIVTSSWLILVAMIFDFLDGFSARLLNAYSAIGRELDSLADVVSFGVAPGFIIYHLLNNSLALNTPGFPDYISVKNKLIFFLPALMPVCAALRLAIFNLDTTQATSFKGLPTPANALAVISLTLAAHYTQSEIFSSLSNSPVFLILFTIGLSLIMVSRIPLLSLKFSNLKLEGNEGRYILIVSVLISLAILGIAAAPLIIPIYIIVSGLSLLF
jgi:CDP-diacylglycerol---serine O-phosphatidyltransferase